MKIVRLLLAVAIASGTLFFSGVEPAPLAAQDGGYHMLIQRDVYIPMRDGVRVAVTIRRPAGPGRFPALLGASPYRYDNDSAPWQTFIWNETGPMDFYVAHGYAYVRLDVRGTGKSGGDYDFFGPKEQHDLADVIEWIARQPWSSGKVGGIGQSYYAMSQWFMAEQQPKHLACIAPYDGNIDNYRTSEYQGGIPSSFGAINWDGTRSINEYPADGAPGRVLKQDMPYLIASHPTYDAWWKARTAYEHIRSIKVPVYSIGIWGKLELHLPGNLMGYQMASGPRKLLVTGALNSAEAHRDFESVAFHEKVLLPFYEWCLKGKTSDYPTRPNVQYSLRNTVDVTRSATAWPPSATTYETLYLGKGPTGSVTSLNDGSLAASTPAAGAASVSYTYPVPGWTVGTVGPGPGGAPDPARRVLTFTTAPLDADLEMAGPAQLVLYASSTARDTNFIVKLSEQLPQSDADRAKDLNPKFVVVTKGWQRAAFHTVDEARSTRYVPFYDFTAPQPLTPGRIYEVRIPLVPMAYLFKKGNRVRVEVVNGDSPLSDPSQYVHQYKPSQVGTDTIYQDAAHPSHLDLPLTPNGAAS